MQKKKSTWLFSKTVLSTIVIMIVFVIFIFTVIGFFIKKDNSDYWSNYWNFMAGFLGVVVALFTFTVQIRSDSAAEIAQRKLESDRNDLEKYQNFQDMMITDFNPLFVDFDPIFSSGDKLNQNLDLLNKLAHELVILLYALDDGKIKRGQAQNILDARVEDENPTFKKFEDSFIGFDDFETQIIDIINSSNNRRVVNMVEKMYPDLEIKISEMRKSPQHTELPGQPEMKESVQHTELPEQYEKKESAQEGEKFDLNSTEHVEGDQLNKTIKTNNPDDNVLGYWVLNLWSARNAKYLIGVSTIDKRVLASFKITDGKRINKDQNNRVYFGDNATTPIFSIGDESLDDTPLPGLEKWTARNPVLYYKQFLVNLSIELDADQKKFVAEKLDIDVQKFEKLNPRDIIIVRTPKLG